MGLLLDGLNVKLKKITGKTKSSGIKPKAPMSEFMSPKNGSMAAITVEIVTANDREITLGITLRLENSGLFGSPNVCSNTSFVGCKYTCINIPWLVSSFEIDRYHIIILILIGLNIVTNLVC
jgi:hypothetical protein